jgi:hypothetical protein
VATKATRRWSQLIDLALIAALPGQLMWAPTAQATFPGTNGKIAYGSYSEAGLFTMEPDGSGKTIVPGTGPNDHWPDWSSDGQRIALHQP